jgi:Protein of unknown function (DUF732)
MGKRQGRHRRRVSRGARLLRTATAVVAVGGITFTLIVFGPGRLDGVWADPRPEQRFVSAVRAEGHSVEPGPDQVLVTGAAQKLCERKDDPVSSADRRASTLTQQEIDAVRRTFGDDSEAFIKVSLHSYCP